MKMQNKYLLPFLAFVVGMVLMVFELVAARLLAPTIGSSTYIWTSVIGVIIAMLAVGVWVGGRLADARDRLIDLVAIIFLIATMIVVVLYFAVGFLDQLSLLNMDSRLKGVIASLVLFAPTSFAIGLSGPYLAKQNIRSLDKTGQSVASIDAMNALGGIFGTFLTGFILFAMMGASNILSLLVGLLVGVSWMIEPSRHFKLRLAASMIILVLLAWHIKLPQPSIQIDTASARYVVEEVDMSSASRSRVIRTGPSGYQSGINLDHPRELQFWYTKEIARVVDLAPKRNRILVLGGGAYTLPSYFANKYPDSIIDVVEIDQGLVGIARQYFAYDDPSNVRLFTDDARVFVDSTDQKYDVVVVDIYNDTEVPFTILTSQYGESIRRIVEGDGLVVANIIASTSGACGDFLQASALPYLHNFQNGFYRSISPNDGYGNIIAAFSNGSLDFLSGDYRRLVVSDKNIYTDDFAPAEYIQSRCTSLS